jgi:hypothetical protein
VIASVKRQSLLRAGAAKEREGYDDRFHQPETFGLDRSLRQADVQIE